MPYRDEHLIFQPKPTRYFKEISYVWFCTVQIKVLF